MRIRIYQSDKGDCLLLTGNDGRNILVDGGMANAFRDHVQPDLGRLAAAGEALDLVYVSHIDQDHISGVLALLDGIMEWRVYDYRNKKKAKGLKVPKMPRMPAVGEIWHNAFSTFLQENAGPVEDLLAQASRMLAFATDGEWRGLAHEVHELAYSMKEAVQVSQRVSAEQLAIPLNRQFDGKLIIVRSPAGPEASIGGMRISVIGPFEEDVDILRKKWNEWLRGAGKDVVAKLRKAAEEDARSIGTAGSNLEALLAQRVKELGNRKQVTPPNLASVMLLVEEGPRRVLLTGDGHSDDIVEGLRHQGKLDAQGRAHVNVLKVQHHGAAANIRPEFCRDITADHYIFCGNGEHTNPEVDVVDTLCRQRLAAMPARPFTLHFNCASSQAPKGKDRAHMRKVEALVSGHVQGSGGAISARFLDRSSFDLQV